MSIEILYEQVDPIRVNLGTYLKDRGYDLSTDVVDACFVIKAKETDTDGAALSFTTYIGGNITKVPGTTKDQLLVEIPTAHFGSGKLEIGKNYKFAVGIKVTGDTKYREPKLLDNIITIKQDMIRG